MSGELLSDNTTYRVTHKDFSKIENLHEIYDNFITFAPYKGFKKISLDEFIKQFS